MTMLLIPTIWRRNAMMSCTPCVAIAGINRRDHTNENACKRKSQLLRRCSDLYAVLLI